MTYTKEQSEAALKLLCEITQERLNSMGVAMQAVLGPAAQTAASIIESLIIQSYQPTNVTE